MTRCWLSETHLAINPSSAVGPCCRFNGKDTDVKISNRTISKVFNDPVLVDIRESLKSGTRIKGCQKCWFHEDNNIRSMRQFNNEGKDFNSLKELTDAEKIHSLEIAFSNHCNYKCRHCDSFSSSKWLADDKLLGREIPDNMLLESDIDSLELDNLTNLEYVKMLGGEPLLNKNHNKFIKKLDELDILKNVYLEYVTNGSIWPNEEIIELWNKARYLRIIISLDDVEEQFNYFRTDGDFNVVKDTIQKFTSLYLDNRKKVNLSFHCVLNALNLKRIAYIVEYINNNFHHWEYTFDNIKGPEYLTIDQWSASDGQEQIALLNDIYKKTFFNGPKKRNIEKLIKSIENNCIRNDTDLSKLFTVNRILDASRNTDIFAAHPYMKEYDV